MELMVPTVVTLHFLIRQEFFSVGFGLWWLSTALWGVGIYASDAQERMLPLITGDPESHDWTYLLREMGILRYDDVVGGIFYALSFMVLILALFVFWKDLRNEQAAQQIAERP